MRNTIVFIHGAWLTSLACHPAFARTICVEMLQCVSGVQRIAIAAPTGLLAAGDARSGSIKRVAVGEGGIAVSLIHRYLAAPLQTSLAEWMEAQA